MKTAIIGAGAVGAACAKAMLLRGSCHEIVLVDKVSERARGVATDLQHGAVLCPPAVVRSGGYDAVAGAAVVVVTAGINEQAGGATDRADELGRLRLLGPNADVYQDVVPQVAAAAPEALVLVVTDPPDPLADVARELTASNAVVSAGTFLDSVRFRLQIGRRLGCHPSSVDAYVVGEHGKSQVYLWSSARVGGEPVLARVARQGGDPDAFRDEVERAVRDANIDIIDGTGASQHGIGIVTARLVEAVLRDEGLVEPVGLPHPDFGLTLSLPAVIRRSGVEPAVAPPLSADEQRLLAASADVLRRALDLWRRGEL